MEKIYPTLYKINGLKGLYKALNEQLDFSTRPKFNDDKSDSQKFCKALQNLINIMNEVFGVDNLYKL